MINSFYFIDQLRQHYADCIKLSTENKINAKNAFGLHLLEYIDTIIQEKSDNFQVSISVLTPSQPIIDILEVQYIYKWRNYKWRFMPSTKY